MALAQEAPQIPKMLDHLEAGDGVDACRAKGQCDEVRAHHGDVRIGAAHVRARGVVVLQRDRRSEGGQCGRPVALTGTRVHDDAWRRQSIGDPSVCGLMPGEPVLLVGQAGARPLPGGY